MACIDCFHKNVCRNAYSQIVEYPNVCGYFRHTADVVEVVRCKDCKHAYFRYNCKDTMQEIYACEKRPAGRMHKKVGADFFCAHGERK